MPLLRRNYAYVCDYDYVYVYDYDHVFVYDCQNMLANRQVCRWQGPPPEQGRGLRRHFGHVYGLGVQLASLLGGPALPEVPRSLSLSYVLQV